MEQLSVIGLEDDQLVVESASGQRFTIDASAIPEIRRHRPAGATERKTSPREIQALMRAGASAEEVAQRTGDDVEYVRRFESPVIAERDHVLDLALAIPVASGDIDPLARATTFGAAITTRLADLGATRESWFAAKEAAGDWTVRLRFESQGAEREARWAFEPRKGALAPRDKEATALSQQGDASSVLVPRLRAVDHEVTRPTPPVVQAQDGGQQDAVEHVEPVEHDEQAPQAPGQQRFDSGAFQLQVDAPSKPVTPSRLSMPHEPAQQPAAVQEAAISTAKPAAAPNHTADLLEALRKRRGEREAALAEAERPGDDAKQDASAPQPLFEEQSHDEQGVHHTSPLTNARPKRGARAAMPSWDEIVFGSRGDDEPA